MHIRLILASGIFIFCNSYPERIAIVGCGYVGLTCAAILAHAGHTIRCIDTNHHKIDALAKGQLPFYEPGLQDLLFDTSINAAIEFTTHFHPAQCQDIYYICVPTPMNANGTCDCSYLYAAYDTILTTAPAGQPLFICIKSTIPPGTMKTLVERAQKRNGATVDLLYNPEFMREGSALHDMRTRNPIVLGGQSHHALNVMKELLRSALPHACEIITTNFETAELIKYAWNSFSAIRIAYINELAQTCQTIGADIASVTHALACSERLLHTKDLKPGPGFGGSCLPKDTSAFARVLSRHGLETTLVHRAIESNICHKKWILRTISDLIESTKNPQTITLLGLSFKANTNDIRNSVALEIIPLLLERGVHVKVYDPKAMPPVQLLFANIEYCTDAYDAVQDSDAILVLTEWQEFKELDMAHIASACRKKRIIDTRNLYPPAILQQYNFEYVTMGSL